MAPANHRAMFSRVLREYILPEEFLRIVEKEAAKCGDDHKNRGRTVNTAVEALSSLNLSPAYTIKIAKALLRKAEAEKNDEGDSCAETLMEIMSDALLKREDEFIWLDYGGTLIRAMNPYYNQATSGDAQIGLRLWEAEICTLEWLEANSGFIQGKQVIELGAGLGLAGIAAVERLGALSVTLTDTNSDVLENLRVIAECSPASNKIKVAHLEWHDYHQFAGMSGDIIIAADCVYDPKDVPAFAKSIEVLLSSRPNAKALLVCSIRNRVTFDLLISELQESNMLSEKQSLLIPDGSPYSTRTAHMLNKDWSRESVVIMIVHPPVRVAQ